VQESLCRASHWCRKARQPSILMRQSKLRFKIRCGFHGSDGPSYSAELHRTNLATSLHIVLLYCFQALNTKLRKAPTYLLYYLLTSYLLNLLTYLIYLLLLTYIYSLTFTHLILLTYFYSLTHSLHTAQSFLRN